ncbi:Flagellar motor switch protein [Rhodovulum sp. P5]|nr:Flagellar motor switch protein [Rhodovulum sp. P5]
MNSLAQFSDFGDAALPPPSGLTRRQKAAIIVRLVLNEGIEFPIGELPAQHQAGITDAIADMRYVDDNTLQSVIMEFIAELEQFGLSFPGGIDGALALLGDHLSPEASAYIKAKHGRMGGPDPWALLSAQDPAKLAELLVDEAPEIGAVALSKLPSDVAAKILGNMPGAQARRVALAISKTGSVPPSAVVRIGKALADRMSDTPVVAFDTEPELRMGQILDVATSATRDDVLEGIAEEDEELAKRVRMAVFTFADIATRVEPRDIPSITRAVEQSVLITAMAGADAKSQAAVDFILNNISQRMADQLRDEVSEREKPSQEEAEEAMSQITSSLRGMEAAGEITLKSGAPEE